MASSRPKPRQLSLWRRPLLVGVCFGLGYGVTQRLLDLRLPGFVQWGQSFDTREVPGTSLDSLRLRFGAEAQELRGRLDLQELEPAKPAPVEPTAQPAAEPVQEQLPQGDVAPTSLSPTVAPPAPSLPAPAATTQP